MKTVDIFIHKVKTTLSKMSLVNLVLLFVVCIAIVLIAYLFFRKGTYLTVVVKVGEENVLFRPSLQTTGTRGWFAQQFRVGMKELDGFGATNAELTKIYSYDSSPITKNVYLTLKLKTTYNRGSNQYTYRGKPILAGSIIKVYLDKLLLEGLVVKIEGLPDKQDHHKALVTTRFFRTNNYDDVEGVKPHLADTLSVGQVISDDQGKPIIKVVDKQVKDAPRFIATNDGRTLMGTNPLLKDVTFTFEIDTIKYGNRYYVFDDIPILIGQPLPIHTPLTSIYPEISSIKILD